LKWPFHLCGYYYCKSGCMVISDVLRSLMSCNWMHRYSILRRWRHNRCCPLFSNLWVIRRLGQTPGHLFNEAISIMLVHIWAARMLRNSSASVYSHHVTAIIAKTTWEQRFLSFKYAEMSRNRRSLSEVQVIATSRIHCGYINQMTL
jgi:hypothetical protein